MRFSIRSFCRSRTLLLRCPLLTDTMRSCACMLDCVTQRSVAFCACWHVEIQCVQCDVSGLAGWLKHEVYLQCSSPAAQQPSSPQYIS
eukprot:559756-Rhodomonas_salina.2